MKRWSALVPAVYIVFLMLPIYWLLERLPPTRESARRLGLVTLNQMGAAIVDAVEHRPARQRIVEVPDIRRAAESSTSAGSRKAIDVRGRVRTTAVQKWR